MARVTVEDCIDKVTNRFELVLLAVHRARSIAKGARFTVDPDNDKPGVIALREIAEETLSAADTREALIHSMQRNAEVDEYEGSAVPTLPYIGGPALVDERFIDGSVEPITEDQLLQGLERLGRPESSLISGNAADVSHREEPTQWAGEADALIMGRAHLCC